MKTTSIASIVVSTSLFVASSLHAQATAPAQLSGSDTLFGAITRVINYAGLASQVQYIGGGSGVGETELRKGTQNVAPMSRPLSATAVQELQGKGVTVEQHVIGLDGVVALVKRTSAIAQIDVPTLRAIYTCEITDWSKVPGSGATGPIVAYRRNDASGTTDTFKTLVGVSSFGACTKPLDSTLDIRAVTSSNASAIGYSGLSGEGPDNKALAIGVAATGPFVVPSNKTIRDFSYPLARRLYFNAVSGGRTLTDVEQTLLELVLDRSVMDEILIENEFVTCLPESAGGCP